MTTFPKLFKKSAATGVLLEWTVSVEGATIVTRHGQVGGAIQESRDTIRTGKNLGKKNATTPEEQAEAEAQGKYDKKINRERYVASRERAEAGESDAAGGIAPMLALDLKKVKAPRYPADAQRKFNGIRIIVLKQGRDVTLWSRKQEQILCLPHLVKAYQDLLPGDETPYAFDGEGYRHGWSLQKIASFVRQKTTPKEGHEEIGHYVYDLPSCDGPWSVRRAALEAFDFGKGPIVPVATCQVRDVDGAWALADTFAQEGYEGLIQRDLDGEYEEGVRSRGLIKFKRFEDHEYKIVGVRDGRGKFEGLAVFTCVTDSGLEFDCCSPGGFDERAAFLARGVEMIGKFLTIKHLGYTDDGIPNHGVGVAVRDYE
jgi:DNA ligase 1